MALEDHTDDLRKARLTQIDARIAELKAELKTLTDKRKAYAPAKD